VIRRFTGRDLAEPYVVGADQLLAYVVLASKQTVVLRKLLWRRPPEEEGPTQAIAIELVQRIRVHIQNWPEQYHREDAQRGVHDGGVYPDLA
jgi:hypothetical protein